MEKDLGWIKLHRSSFNNKLYFDEPFTRWQAWCDLLLIANHQDGNIRLRRGIKQPVFRGQVAMGATFLKTRWKWNSTNRVLRFLNELADEHQIVMQKSNVTTLISIVNYNKYQADGTQNGTHNGTQNGTQIIEETERKRNANGTQPFVTPMNINMLEAPKNDKNVKNININIPDAVCDPPAASFFPIYSDYNGLPKENIESVIRLVKVVKQVEVSVEDINALWAVFKEQNLTGDKPYSSVKDIYRHFTNWTNKQSFRKKATPRVKKDSKEDSKKVFGIQFINDYKEVIMSDDSTQELTPNQRESAKYNQINPVSIKKI